MLICVMISLFLVKPDWLEFLKGLLIPQRLEYPDWAFTHKEIASRPVWVENDYLRRRHRWLGLRLPRVCVVFARQRLGVDAGSATATAAELAATAKILRHVDRRWLRAPLIDCTLSFAAVLLFTAVFVACGAVILGPQHKVPSGSNLLALQAEFRDSRLSVVEERLLRGRFPHDSWDAVWNDRSCAHGPALK
jgi:hypothetical protein